MYTYIVSSLIVKFFNARFGFRRMPLPRLNLIRCIRTHVLFQAHFTVHRNKAPNRLRCPPQGYGESKHTAGRICLEASRPSHVPTTVCRVGQIAGPTSASRQLKPHDWLLTLIATSKAIGNLLTRIGSMPGDWVPVISVHPSNSDDSPADLTPLGYHIGRDSGDCPHTS